MSIDFWESAGGRSEETEGLQERQVTQGKTRFEASRASNPLASFATRPNKERCSHDPPKGLEND